MSVISAKIVADSICNGNRITTMEVVFPRIIHSELMTHRLFSRNSASSRAIPFEKMVKSVEENPFIPIAWQKDHKGMQGNEYVTDSLDIMKNTQAWLDAKYYAVNQATLLNIGNSVTKQLCNRLLEPFMWHKVLITATEWDNFFELRCPIYEYEGKPYKSFKDLYSENESAVEEYVNIELNGNWEQFKRSINKGQSEIHMMALAEAMWDARNESIPKKLQPGEWHIPYNENLTNESVSDYLKGIYDIRKDGLWGNIEIEDCKVRIATARCARLSYQTLGDDPKIDYKADIKLHDMLLESGHMSPMEHCARAMTDEELSEYVKGKINWKTPGTVIGYIDYGSCNNFKGFIQYRYLIENGEV